MKKNSSPRYNNPVSVYFLSLSSKSTLNSSHYRVRSFCNFTWGNKDYNSCNWSAFTYVDVLLFVNDELSKQKAHTGINVSLSVLKAISVHAWQLGLISLDEHLRIKSIKSIRGHRPPAGRVLESYEIEAIKKLSKTTKEPIHIRDIAIFALGIYCGLRRSEIAKLNIEDIKRNGSISFYGKGNKHRVVFMNSFIKKLINAWLKIKADHNQALFTGITNNKGGRLSVLSIHRSILRVVKQSECERFTTHDLRRTFATSLLDNDADKFAVKRLMGHSNLSTTEIYDRRGDTAAKAAIKLLPY